MSPVRNQFLTTLKQPSKPIKMHYGLPILKKETGKNNLISEEINGKVYGIRRPMHLDMPVKMYHPLHHELLATTDKYALDANLYTLPKIFVN